MPAGRIKSLLFRKGTLFLVRFWENQLWHRSPVTNCDLLTSSKSIPIYNTSIITQEAPCPDNTSIITQEAPCHDNTSIITQEAPCHDNTSIITQEAPCHDNTSIITQEAPCHDNTSIITQEAPCHDNEKLNKCFKNYIYFELSAT